MTGMRQCPKVTATEWVEFYEVGAWDPNALRLPL